MNLDAPALQALDLSTAYQTLVEDVDRHLHQIDVETRERRVDVFAAIGRKPDPHYTPFVL
jgi:hypothetical protein